MMTLGHFVTHKKNPFNEWHWILFYHQVTKVHPPSPPKKKSARFFYNCLSSEAKSKEKKNMHKKNKNIKEDSQDSRVINYNIPATNPMRKLLPKKKELGFRV